MLGSEQYISIHARYYPPQSDRVVLHHQTLFDDSPRDSGPANRPRFPATSDEYQYSLLAAPATDHSQYRFTPSMGLPLSLEVLRTCRQVSNEVATFLYKSKIFRFDVRQVDMHLIRGLRVSLHDLQIIRKLQLRISIADVTECQATFIHARISEVTGLERFGLDLDDLRDNYCETWGLTQDYGPRIINILPAVNATAVIHVVVHRDLGYWPVWECMGWSREERASFMDCVLNFLWIFRENELMNMEEPPPILSGAKYFLWLSSIGEICELNLAYDSLLGQRLHHP